MLLRHPLSVTWLYDKRVMRCQKAWVMDYRHHGNISVTHCDVTSCQGGAVEGILNPPDLELVTETEN